jgi:hypothetical protein
VCSLQVQEQTTGGGGGGALRSADSTDVNSNRLAPNTNILGTVGVLLWTGQEGSFLDVILF